MRRMGRCSTAQHGTARRGIWMPRTARALHSACHTGACRQPHKVPEAALGVTRAQIPEAALGVTRAAPHAGAQGQPREDLLLL